MKTDYSHVLHYRPAQGSIGAMYSAGGQIHALVNLAAYRHGLTKDQQSRLRHYRSLELGSNGARLTIEDVKP